MLTDSERKLLSDLREAEARATPGVWAEIVDEDGGWVYSEPSDVVGDGDVVCQPPDADLFESMERWAGNRQFIALARNNLTPLLDLVERLDRELCEVKRSLKHEQAARIAMERQYVPE